MRRVFLISGHNGSGTGANGFIDEGKETVILRDLIAENLKEMGIVAIKDDNLTPLTKVVQWLRNQITKKDICIDIHFNASTNPNANGSEVFIPTKNTYDEVELANMFRITLSKVFKDRGVSLESKSHHGKIAMLSGFDCCNILLEVCFVSNKLDSENYFEKRDFIAYELALDILEYSRKYETQLHTNNHYHFADSWCMVVPIQKQRQRASFL
jgi:N-acetylmuramoyl-L-alanine amidase